MTAQRGLTLLGALIALLIAFGGAAWMWLSLEGHQPPGLILVSAALVFVASMFAARCVGHLLDSFGVGARAPVRAVRTECPSCAAPLRPGTVRCSSCMELV